MIRLDGRPVAVFSGGSLLVGAAGRTDLRGAQRASWLARLQHGSLQRLATLPDDVALYPTHGAGSFCAASASGRSTSTIGEERGSNSGLTEPGPARFAGTQLAGLGHRPSYRG